MNEMLNVVVDGLWCQGDKSLAVRLVSASQEPLPGWEPAPILMSICPAA
jgi:vanillate O-demethylase ferredoxin subunit